MDEFFLFERVGCPNTCGGIIETSKIDNFNTFKKWAREVFAEKLPMGKCKIKQVFGVFYYEQFTDDEFNKIFDESLCIEVKDVHTKEDLVKFTEKESLREWKIEEAPLWRWFCVTDYSKD